MYDQGKVFIGHEFRIPIIEMEHRMTEKPRTSGNPMSNTVLKRINQVLGNLVRNFNTSTQTYADEDDMWTGILSAAAFSIFSTTNRKKFIV